MARPRRVRREPDIGRVKMLVDDAYDVIMHQDEDDVSGHKIAVNYGYLCRIIEGLKEEVWDA